MIYNSIIRTYFKPVYKISVQSPWEQKETIPPERSQLLGVRNWKGGWSQQQYMKDVNTLNWFTKYLFYLIEVKSKQFLLNAPSF